MQTPQYNIKNAAEKIRAWQKEAGLKGKDIAKLCGMSAAYYCDIRKGKQRGSIKALGRIVDMLGHKLEDLFEPTPEDVMINPMAVVKNANIDELREKIEPILGGQTENFIQCFELWRKAPAALRKSLEAWAMYPI